ncbi:hypothetical protein [Streptomyces sp. SPB074]|uniref:hypothetical protein n=1 Tax=Streptomyces sp. (strain SPB074) TaxID=465543 RepID=UPI00017F2904|nr:hypothetical protein [Streptomyces sp. SPB074]EDY43219.1 conserved hypothetical protein [Streptomyces sp. SPB074]
MELLGRAAPGVERYAERAAEAACELADLAGPDGWNAAAAEDVLDAIDALTEAMGAAGPDLAQALAACSTATARARRILGIGPAASVGEGPVTASAAVPAPHRAPRRRGLGPGYQGIRTDR